MSVVLLVGALLLGRSLIRLLHTDLGVDVDHAVTASMSLSLNRDLSSAQQIDRSSIASWRTFRPSLA